MDPTLTSSSRVESTLTPSAATRRVWDVLIIGAGPAGSVAAHELARRGLTTLLVDRAQFPRHKVCGCCLGAAGLAELEAIGLGQLLCDAGAVPLRMIRLAYGNRQVALPIPTGAALSRSVLDAGLIRRAIDRQAHFLAGAKAELNDIGVETRSLYLRRDDVLWRVQARVVLIADGLGGRSLVGERGFGRHAWRHSRIGAGTLCAEAPDFYEPGVIHMACHRRGYVGLVRIESGALDVAAAMDPDFMRECGSPGAAAARILASAGMPSISQASTGEWHGTPWLTSQPTRVAAERLFVLGDAAGYVEPFTGEGMTWAIASARGVVEPVMRAAEQWSTDLEDEWTQRRAQLLAGRQRACRWIARGLRHPGLTRGVIAALSRWPALAKPIISRLNRPLTVDGMNSSLTARVTA